MRPVLTRNYQIRLKASLSGREGIVTPDQKLWRMPNWKALSPEPASIALPTV
jgi:hypothetical protein